MSRVDLLLELLDCGHAGEFVCFAWPGVGCPMGYVYGTVTLFQLAVGEPRCLHLPVHSLNEAFPYAGTPETLNTP